MPQYVKRLKPSVYLQDSLVSAAMHHNLNNGIYINGLNVS